MTFTCGDRTWLTSQGAFVVPHAGIEHGFTVSPDTPARMPQMSSAPGLERFFPRRRWRGHGSEPSSAWAAVARPLAAAERYGIELLGPAGS